MKKLFFKIRDVCFVLTMVVSFQFASESVGQPEIGLVYFLPSDQTAQSDIDARIHTHITAVQTLYADRMETAGYGRKTFTFEHNDDGTAKVHHLTGEQTDAYYEAGSKWEVWDEIRAAGYEADEKIYIAFIDLSSEMIDGWCGSGGDWLVNFENDNILWKDTGGGVVTLTASGTCFNGEYGKHITAHELGHALGLRHDWRGEATTNYATGEDPMVTSACALEWLEGHLYFNTDLGESTGETTIEMFSPSISGKDVTLTFSITDVDGLHQAQFFRFALENEYLDLRIIACESLDTSPATLTFTTSQLTAETKKIALRVIDAVGRSTEKHFTVDLTAISSHPADVNADGVVNILDMLLIVNNMEKQGLKRSDVNGDGVVNILDLVIVANAFE